MTYYVHISKGNQAKAKKETKMKIALAHNHYNADHLAKIKSEMVTLGTPKIKAVWMEAYGHFAAIEGCHRLRAAHELGLTPEIEEVEYSDALADGAEDGLTVEQIADSSYNSEILEFAE